MLLVILGIKHDIPKRVIGNPINPSHQLRATPQYKTQDTMDLDTQPTQPKPDAEIGPLALSKPEREVLELYDRLQELKVEIALLNAQEHYIPGREDPYGQQHGRRTKFNFFNNYFPLRRVRPARCLRSPG